MPIYAWGSNGSGQLGIGHLEDVCEPTLHTQSSSAIGDEVKNLTAGGNHSLILYESGRLSIIGKSSGLHKSLDLHEIELCSATWDASFILTRSSQLLALGTGERGELGLGENVKQTAEPVLVDISNTIPAKTSIIQLASGVQHTVAVLSNGEILGWGNGRKGQLGEPAGIVWKPRKLANVPFNVKRALCGQSFTLLAGDHEEGQCAILGQDKFGIRSGAPTVLTGWRDIGASWGSVFVLSADGRLISWGRNDHGQLAPAGLSNVDQIAVGSEHALALSRDNKLYAWGWGEHGNCGPDIDEAGDVREAKQMILPAEAGRIKGIAAGCATSWFWT